MSHDVTIERTPSANVITARNPHNFVPLCFIAIHYHPDTQWEGNMEVNCEGHCHIRQKNIDAIKFTARNGLIVGGDWVDINLTNLEAE